MRRTTITARVRILIWIALSVCHATPVVADEFLCPLGEAVAASLGQGVSMRTCMWEKEPSVFVRTGPLELIRNGILILKMQTDAAGKLHGRFTAWNDQGEVVENGNYVRGLKHGPWLKIDENGNRQTLLFSDGSLVEP